MTHEEIKDTMKAFAEMANGSVDFSRVEIKVDGEWNYMPNRMPQVGGSDLGYYPHRIKPEPRKRLIRVEELPMPCFVSKTSGSGGYSSILAVNVEHQTIQWAWDGKIVWLSIKDIFGKWPATFSPDGKTWNSFEVEDTEGA